MHIEGIIPQKRKGCDFIQGMIKRMALILTSVLFTAGWAVPVPAYTIPGKQLYAGAADIFVCHLEKQLSAMYENTYVSIYTERDGSYVASAPFPEKKKTVLHESPVPNDAAGCKSYNFTYMDWKLVTCKSSLQYPVLNSPDAWTDRSTGIRMVGERICIAIGQGYGYVPGDKIDVYLNSGNVVECIIGDMKATADCDASGRYQAADGSVVEIIIDSDYFAGTAQYPDTLHGTVEKLVLVEEE